MMTSYMQKCLKQNSTFRFVELIKKILRTTYLFIRNLQFSYLHNLGTNVRQALIK